MSALGIAIAFGVRILLVLLFLPFSALDKILDFKDALAQAEQDFPSVIIATALLAVGFCIEVGMSVCILAGIADRIAALVLAVYCVLTAILWKRFWRFHDFWRRGESRARTLFWDFWKNVALAGGFLLITFGPNAGSAIGFFAHPLSSTHPYRIEAAHE